MKGQDKGFMDEEDGKTKLLINQHELDSVDESKKDMKPEKKGLFLNIFAILLYGSTSLVTTVFNKKVLATYDFEASNMLMLLQLFLSSGSLLTSRWLGLTKFPAPNKETAIKILPLSLCYFSSVLLALVALPDLSLAMYSALKRLVALMILVCEYYVLNKTSSVGIWCSVGVMVSGAVVAGVSDLTFDFYGYAFALSSCLFQALYMVLVKKHAKVEMLFYNSTLSIPFVGLLTYYFNELEYTLNYPLFNDTGFKVYFSMSILLGAFLNFVIFFCTSVNSPLTTSVTGQAKNILTTILGVLIFNDLVIQPVNILGLCINACGGFWYAYQKLMSGGGGG